MSNHRKEMRRRRYEAVRFVIFLNYVSDCNSFDMQHLSVIQQLKCLDMGGEDIHIPFSCRYFRVSDNGLESSWE